MKLIIGISLSVLLSGCLATTQPTVVSAPVVVETPVAKYCLEGGDIPGEPVWPLEVAVFSKNAGAIIIAAAAEEIKIRRVYVASLRSLLARCASR